MEVEFTTLGCNIVNTKEYSNVLTMPPHNNFYNLNFKILSINVTVSHPFISSIRVIVFSSQGLFRMTAANLLRSIISFIPV